MKILFINQCFYPDLVATAQHLTDITQKLIGRGHEVTVIASRRGYTPPYELYDSKDQYKGVNVIRVWPFSFGKSSRVLRVIDAALLNLAFACRLLWLPKFHKVIGLTSPPLIGFFSCLFARLKRSEFIYWVMDINPDEAIHSGWIRADSLQARLLNAMATFIFKASSKIVVLDKYMADRLVSKGVSSEKIIIMPPWSPENHFDDCPHDRNPFRDKHNLKNKFVVMYSGNLSICHPLDTLLRAAIKLKNNTFPVFMFIGDGARANDVLSAKETHRLSNISYLPYQERNQLKYSLSAADLQVVVMGEPYVGIVHPSKIYGILSTGKPFVFIGPKKSAIGDMIKKYGVGYQVNHGDVAGLVAIINKVTKLGQKEKGDIREKSLALKEKEFNREKIMHDLSDLLEGDER